MSSGRGSCESEACYGRRLRPPAIVNAEPGAAHTLARTRVYRFAADTRKVFTLAVTFAFIPCEPDHPSRNDWFQLLASPSLGSNRQTACKSPSEPTPSTLTSCAPLSSSSVKATNLARLPGESYDNTLEVARAQRSHVANLSLVTDPGVPLPAGFLPGSVV